MSPVKEEAKQLIEGLPDSATWDDVMYAVYVRDSIEQGIADAEAGRVYTQEEVEARVLARFRTGK